MILDFAENYACRYQDEIQSVHWGRSSATIHPIDSNASSPDQWTYKRTPRARSKHYIDSQPKLKYWYSNRKTEAEPGNQPNNEKQEVDSDDEWNEATDSDPVHNLDTVLQHVDFNQAISWAPDEGYTPMSIFKDKDAEYLSLSFPTIYCGQTLQDNKDRQMVSEIGKAS